MIVVRRDTKVGKSLDSSGNDVSCADHPTGHEILTTGEVIGKECRLYGRKSVDAEGVEAIERVFPGVFIGLSACRSDNDCCHSLAGIAFGGICVCG